MVGDHFGQGALVLPELAPKGCDTHSGYGRSLPGTACASSPCSVVWMLLPDAQRVPKHPLIEGSVPVLCPEDPAM